MAEQATSAPQTSGDDRSQEAAELREELKRSKEEVLRLRDLLIGKDAELGALRGQVAELEAGVARLLNVSARIRSRIPSFVWSVGGRLRRRRGSQG